MQAILPAVGPNGRRGIQSTISLQKAAIKKGCLVATFDEHYDNGLSGRHYDAVRCQDAAHPDLLAAFQALVPFFCQLTDQLTEAPAGEDAADEDQQLLAPFTVTGVSYDSKGLGFTLIGTRELASGKLLNLISPFLTFDEVPDEVPELLQALNAEVELGLRGKCADAGRQLDLFPSPGSALLLTGEAEEANWEDVPADEPAAPRRLPPVNSSPCQGGGGPIGPEGGEPSQGEVSAPDQPRKRGRGRPRKQA